MINPIVLGLLAASATGQGCQETTRHADGTVSVRVVPDTGQGAQASSSAASASGGASSSVSVSSSSTDGESRSSAQSTGDQGRTMRVERDDRGCRIIIIEQGER